MKADLYIDAAVSSGCFHFSKGTFRETPLKIGSSHGPQDRDKARLCTTGNGITAENDQVFLLGRSVVWEIFFWPKFLTV